MLQMVSFYFIFLAISCGFSSVKCFKGPTLLGQITYYFMAVEFCSEFCHVLKVLTWCDSNGILNVAVVWFNASLLFDIKNLEEPLLVEYCAHIFHVTLDS